MNLNTFLLSAVLAWTSCSQAMDVPISLEALPLELKEQIFNYLEGQDFLNLRQTSKQLASDSSFNDHIYPNSFYEIDLVPHNKAQQFKELTAIILDDKSEWEALIKAKAKETKLNTDALRAKKEVFYGKMFCDLGKLYLKELRTSPLYNKAISCFTYASELGDDEANWIMAKLYYQGLGVPQDSEVAFKYYAKCSKKFQADALCEMGKIYLWGHGNVAQLSKYGCYLLTQAALNHNCAEACYILGCLPRTRAHLHYNIYYLQKAQDLGHPLSEEKLNELMDSLT